MNNYLMLNSSSNKRLRYLRLLKNKQRNHRVFLLEQLSENDCQMLFRFNANDIHRIRKLLRIPWRIKCKNNVIATGVEGLCILLRRLAYPNRLFDLRFLFHRQVEEISVIFNFVLNHIMANFAYLLSDLNQWWLTNEWLTVYGNATSAKGSPLQKCWGFIDGTVRAMCRPSKHQRHCYNGHKRLHALKYQSVVAANGLVANLYGPIEGRRHDSFMLSESKLLQQLSEKNQATDPPFCLYGDPAYPLRPELMAPFKGSNLSEEQMQFNKKMSKCRIAVEWTFGKTLQLFAFLDYKKNQKLNLQPLAKYFKVATILTNMHTCLYGSQTSTFFNLQPPSVEEYILGPTNNNI